MVGLGQFVNLFGSGVVYPFAALYFVEPVGLPSSIVGAGLLDLEGRLSPAENAPGAA